MDIGFVFDGDWIEAVKNSDVVYNLGADEINIEAGPFVIYQGSHGDRGAHRADLILPSASYTEEPGLFVNLEGRVQLAHRANFAPGDAKENWAILRALSSELDNKLPYDNLTELREILFKKFGHLRHIGLIEEKVEDGKALETALLIATSVANQSPSSIAQCKELIHKARLSNEPYQEELEPFVNLFDTKDQKEGVDAFLDKRKPNWQNA